MGGLSETGFLRETARIVEILWRNPVSCRDRDRVYRPSETGFLRETAWEVEILWRNPVSCRDRDRVYGRSETGFLRETARIVEILWRNPVSCRVNTKLVDSLAQKKFSPSDEERKCYSED
jgi:hypothetical protein